MPLKRNTRVMPKKTTSTGDVAGNINSRDILELLQQKIMNSPALNGGFDTLMLKIEGIEKCLGATGEKVDSIHEAVYHPDTGLFARVKSVEQWRSAEEKAVEKEAKLNDEHEKLVRGHDDQLKELSKFKERSTAIVRWLVISLATGGAGLLGKLLFDFVSGHVKFV